ncbi:FecR family protein [Novosphingobium sp.]|jgi:transmembrane sensor|uniref:FecR family protein n=1 Tax=Novosphingobium sp. TaxID=1874826 RepID=UPI002FE34110
MALPENRSDARLPEEVLLAASDWHLRLQDDPEDIELRGAFETWLARDDAHRAGWALLEESIALARQTEPVHRADWQARRNDLPAVAAPSRRKARPAGPRSRAMKRAGLSAVAAVLVAVVAGPQVLLQLRADHVSGTGKIEHFALEDGSQVILSAGSAISQDFNRSRRHIGLLEGEAWFDVAHDSARPFTVQAQDMTVTVTGTAFDVAMTDETLSVSVARGSVRVEGEGGSRLAAALKPGQRLSLDRRTGRATVLAISPLEIGAWRSGRLAVRNASVADVVEVLERHFPGRVILRGEALRTARVTGVYDLADPVGSLETLLDASGATMTRITPWLILVSAPDRQP